MVEQVKEDVYWVGFVDWDKREFHGHELSTHRGTTYNSYLVLDDKNVLIDSVKSEFTEEWLNKIEEVLPLEEIDYVIGNHAEVDHSGGFPELFDRLEEAQFITSSRGAETFPGHYGEDWDLQTVETGDTLDIGEKTMTFVEAPMLHWPDSMFVYLDGANVLFPNDAFGQHYATAHRFNDQVNQEELWQEALKYYVNILTPFSALVKRKIEELKELDVPVDVIAPSHGVIWCEEPMQIVGKYAQWAEQEAEERVVVLYDTMWEATRKMADKIGDGVAETGVDCKVLPAATSDRNDLLVEIFKAALIAIGSPTLNSGVLPTITPLLEDLRGLGFKNKLGAAFGSYGWSGESIEAIEDHFEKSDIPLAEEGLKCKWQPDEEDLERCREYGRKLGKKVLD